MEKWERKKPPLFEGAANQNPAGADCHSTAEDRCWWSWQTQIRPNQRNPWNIFDSHTRVFLPKQQPFWLPGTSLLFKDTPQPAKPKRLLSTPQLASFTSVLRLPRSNRGLQASTHIPNTFLPGKIQGKPNSFSVVWSQNPYDLIFKC